MDFEGTVSNLAGKCPAVTFTARGFTVIADGSTDFKKGDCGDLRNGRSVAITGTELNGVVHATRIEVKKEDD